MLAPYVDGEAPADQRASVDAHIERCPPCRTRVAEERAAHEVLQVKRDSLRACASDTLRARCAAHRQARLARGVMARRPWIPLSLAATLLLAVGGVFLFGLNNSVQALATQLTLDHVKCFRLAPESVTSDAAAAGKEWASTQGWALDVPTSSRDEQLEFLCVRRCYVTEGRVAHLMYKWRGQPLSVYVLPSAIAHPNDRDIVERLGHEAVVWSERGRTYVVLARGRPQELEGVVGYVKANAR
jgi:anti-sigma factor RsiW